MSQKTHHYSNGEITIVWQPELCKHSKICWKGLNAVFDPGKRPWINPNAAATDVIIEQVQKCPSGALSFFMNNEAASNNTI
ncbi:MAG: (4Fe-4S)-binding protein [Lacibacter sp.]